MIDPVAGGHGVSVTGAPTFESPALTLAHADREGERDGLGRRLRAMVDAHHDFVFRALRRLGVPEAFADDAAQQVWLVAARRLTEIDVDRERSFLFGTTMRVASEERRARARRREIVVDEAPDAIAAGASPDDALDEVRARAFLDRVLAELPMELRAVFVLFELEELSTPEIAAMLELPLGTAASRLRRARERFQDVVRRTRAQAGGVR